MNILFILDEGGKKSCFFFPQTLIFTYIDHFGFVFPNQNKAFYKHCFQLNVCRKNCLFELVQLIQDAGQQPVIVQPVSKVDVAVIRLCVHHQRPSWSFRHSNHRETQDWEHPGWEPTTSTSWMHLRSLWKAPIFGCLAQFWTPPFLFSPPPIFPLLSSPVRRSWPFLFQWQHRVWQPSKLPRGRDGV